MTKKFISIVRSWMMKYPIVIAVPGIYAYYLLTTLDVFRKSGTTHLRFLDFVLQYDSLIWMWLLVYVITHVQVLRSRIEEEQLKKKELLLEVEKSALASTVLRDVIQQLQDTINNPLAIIGMQTAELRKIISSDPAAIRQLDHINALLQRIHNAIKDIAAYESTHLLEQLHEKVRAEAS